MKWLIDDQVQVNQLIFGSTTEWLFPTVNRAGNLCRIRAWREKNIALETGHELRRTYRSLAQLIGIADSDAEMMISHKLPAIKEAYINRHIITPAHRGNQEQISETIASLLLGATVMVDEYGKVKLSSSADPYLRLHRSVEDLLPESG